MKVAEGEEQVIINTHWTVGLIEEFALPHLKPTLSLLQLLLFGAQVPLQLLQSLKGGFDLTPAPHPSKYCHSLTY